MVTSTIHPNEKKAFIYWFLNQYEMKIRESNWILTYIANHPKLLKNVHFVRHTKNCPRSMLISTKCSNKVPFRFSRKQVIAEEPEKAFHDIRLNRDEPLYIQLDFLNWKQNPHYALVLEENPFHINNKRTDADKEKADKIIEVSLNKRKRDMLIKEIDLALDERDKIRFAKLTKELQAIDDYLSSQSLY
jgi:uncharacterized protein YpiB (UPF0302 family)